MTSPAATAQRWSTVGRFLLAVAAGSLFWEVGHLPLYTLWLTGTPAEIAYDVMHCTVGDILIAAMSLATAILAFGRKDWPGRRYGAVAVAMILAATAYTVFSEWLNVTIRGAWAYRAMMPRLPPLGTGVTPVLQWIIVPALAFWFTRPNPEAEQPR